MEYDHIISHKEWVFWHEIFPTFSPEEKMNYLTVHHRPDWILPDTPLRRKLARLSWDDVKKDGVS